MQTRLPQLQNQVTLYKALGGGWATRDEAGADGFGSAPGGRAAERPSL